MTAPSCDSTIMFYGSVTLPQDIVDIIIDNLSDNTPSLKACSLVAPAWRSTSQKLLHRTMVFRTSLPLSTGHAVSYASHSPAPSSEKTRLLLGTSFHLLRYARSFIIRGDRDKGFGRGGTSRPKPQPRVPDSSLLVFLWQISSLALPLLSSIELRDLIWTRVDTDLQRALISLLSQGFVKGVSLVNCAIPLGVQWLRFIGPETMSLQLHRIAMFDNSSAEHETPITGIPISSAPNLTDLQFGQLCGSEVIRWILGSLKAPGTPSNATTAVLRSRSWHESITTLSLYCFDAMEDLFKLVQTLPGLTTLKFNTQGCVAPFPFYGILRFPTLEYLHILPLSSGRMSWLISSFKPFNSLSPSHHRTVPTLTKPKFAYVDMWVELNRTAALLSRITLPEILALVREFDDVVAGIPSVEVSLRMTVSTLNSEDGPGRIEYDETKKILTRLRVDLKALKLEVC